jgi:hypothetical protein
MKKTISIVLALGLLAAGTVTASAGEYRYGGHRGYYGHGGHGGAGAFFVGLLGGAILGSVIANSRPDVVYAPPPAAYYPPAPAQVWVPGHYEPRYVRQWVPGHWELEDDGYGRSRRVWVPGYYEDVGTQAWIPGHWEERG